MAQHSKKPVDVGLPRLQEVKVRKKRERQKFPDGKLEQGSDYRLLITKAGEKKIVCSCIINGEAAERIIDEARKSVQLPARKDALKQLDKVTDEFEELRKMIQK